MIKEYFLFIILGFFIYCPLKAQDSDCKTAFAAVSKDSLVKFVNELTGRNPIWLNDSQQWITSRYAYHPDNELAAAYLKNKAKEYGFKLEETKYSQSGENVIWYKEGTSNPNKAFLLCAHYDCVGFITAPFQGADDNASGVAAMIEAGRILKQTQFPFTLILGFWDEEEIGLIGSKAFAPDGPLGFWDIQGVINMDMIGYDGNNDSLALVHVFPVGNSLVLGQKIIDLNNKYGGGLNLKVKNPGETATDQQSFWLKGSTAIGFTEDYDNDFSPHWHRQSDSIENMNIPYFTKMAKVALGTICELAKTGDVTSIPSFSKPLMLISPNPVNDLLEVFLSESPQQANLFLFDAQGQLVIQHPFESNKTNIHTSELKNGLYMICIRWNEKVLTQKLLIQH